ncbi:hypothetical protein DPMN_175975 [Dreissena polymorpha]|uniref:Uncharacterized protein n=1 Tax=Dreissena polymorpha TaxID=45954 RepID=A0A9D4E7K6_DREPO|nr:hypothetical protein DPMN_175975 [Dreissena polymorpha]
MAHSGILRGGALHQTDSTRSLADTRAHEILYNQSYILALRELRSGTCFLFVPHRGDTDPERRRDDDKIALREDSPMVVCALCNTVVIAVSCLKKHRRTSGTESGGLQLVRHEDTEDVAEWTSICLALNVILLIRVVVSAASLREIIMFTPEDYKIMILLHVFHAKSFYIVPMCALFISIVRQSIADVLLKIFSVFRAAHDNDLLAIRFVNISQTVKMSQDA